MQCVKCHTLHKSDCPPLLLKATYIMVQYPCMCHCILEMVRTRKRRGPNRFRSCRFTLVRDPALKKVDSNTRRIHSQLMLFSTDANKARTVMTRAKTNWPRSFETKVKRDEDHIPTIQKLEIEDEFMNSICF